MKISFVVTFDHPLATMGKTKGEPLDRLTLMENLSDSLAMGYGQRFENVAIAWTPTLQPPRHDGKPIR